jgi:hypothetical protein
MNSNRGDQNPITPFAVTNYRDIRSVFGIKEKNRRGHMYVIGKTGTGKSTLIQNMIVSDINDGNGVGLIDPHGDLAGEVLNHIPDKRVNDVIYFSPADIAYPVAFNPLESVPPDYRGLVVSGIISVFKKVWSDSWGPRLEHILRHALLTLMERPGSTFIDLPRLLTDKDFRAGVLAGVTTQHVKQFWFSEFDKYSSYLKAEATAPILNKIGAFVASPLLRNIVGQRTNTLDFRTMMDERKILIANLAKGQTGEDNCSLLGAMIVTKLQLAALSRVDVEEKDRISFYLYVDEVHEFLTLAFADILSAARKYGLSLVLAHQYMEQLDQEVRSAIFGNVGTVVSFRVGAEDAEYLAREFSPVFDEADLINLPNHHIYLKLMIDGVTSKPFSAVTLMPPATKAGCAHHVIEASRKRYARPREIVEREIAQGGAALSSANGRFPKPSQPLLFP